MPTRRKKPKKDPADSYHHNIYVILLDPKVAKHPSVLRVNPNRDPAKDCLYVGMTGLPVEHRFENHKNGYKSAWTARKYGIRLVPEFYEYLNPLPYDEAVRMEVELAADLRAAGYTVTGGK
ncbi:MAG: hypothetical protein ABI443_09950 [Chthoniobacterales bacterium]